MISTAGESHTLFLSISLNQETSGRRGTRIRLAGESEKRRERVSVNPYGLFRGTPITVEKHGVCSGELGSGKERAGLCASLNPSHLHERGSSKLAD